MIGRQVAQGALFYGFRLDEHVPSDHLLRCIDGVLNFGFVRESLAASYSATGPPSIDPELMLRMLLVGYMFGIRSERRLCEKGTSTSLIADSAGLTFPTAYPTIPPSPRTGTAVSGPAISIACRLSRWSSGVPRRGWWWSAAFGGYLDSRQQIDALDVSGWVAGVQGRW